MRKESKGALIGGVIGGIIGVVYLLYNLLICRVACSSIINRLSEFYIFLPFIIPLITFLIGYLVGWLFKRNKNVFSVFLFVSLIFVFNVGLVLASEENTNANLILNFSSNKISPTLDKDVIRNFASSESIKENDKRLDILDDSDKVIFTTGIPPSNELINLSLSSGDYKILKVDGEETTEENITLKAGEQIIVPMYSPAIEGYIIDTPSYIVSSQTNLPLLAIADDEVELYPDLDNIWVYDANNGDSLVTYTKWTSSKVIDSTNTPFFYLFNINKNSFSKTDGKIKIKVLFELSAWWLPNNWEGPIEVEIWNKDLSKIDGWYCGDTHYHSSYTNTKSTQWIFAELGAPINATTKSLDALGLDWVTITDHSNSFNIPSNNFNNFKNECDKNNKCLIGEEVNCRTKTSGNLLGDSLPGNHYLAYNLDSPLLDDGQNNVPYCDERVNLINSISKFGYVAHPESTLDVLGIADIISKWENYSLPFTGLEVWNKQISTDLDNGLIKWKELLLNGRKIFISAGSDAHGDLNTYFGKEYTCVYAPYYSKSNIFNGLKNGNSFISNNGALTLEISYNNKTVRSGETIEVPKGELLKIDMTYNLEDTCHLSLYQGIIGESNENRDGFGWISSSGTETENERYIFEDGYYRVDCLNEGTNKRIYTNPIWIKVVPLDSDGDGIVDDQDSCPSIYGAYCHGCPILACPAGYDSTCPASGAPICETNNLTCLRQGETIYFSVCNPDILDYTCEVTKCQLCVNEVSQGVYCPMSIDHCNNLSECVYLYNETTPQNVTLPVITILNPINEYSIVSSDPIKIEFSFKVTKASELEKCELIVNGNSIATKNKPISLSTQKLYYTAIPGSYVWKIICTQRDSYGGNIIISETRNFTIAESMGIINCTQNSDCGDGYSGDNFCSGNNVTRGYIYFICNNPGTIQSYCTNSMQTQIIEICPGSASSSWRDNYCKNNDVYHNKSIVNAGCNLGECYSDYFINESLVKICQTNEICNNGNCICVPNLVNTSWSEWKNISCLSNNKINQSRYLIEYDSNSCGAVLNQTLYEYQTILSCGENNQTNSTSENLILINPTMGVYNDGSVMFNINSTTKFSKIVYSDNGGRESTLCTNCYRYTRKKTLGDGNHTLLFRGITSDGKNATNQTRLLIDSKDPQISNIKPQSRKYTNGSDFYVKYTEDNLKNINLFYGSDEIFKSDCLSGRNKNCTFYLNLSKYDNQTIDYQFILIDIANNIDKSRLTTVKVDTTLPIISNFKNWTSGRYAYFNMTILNEDKNSFDKVEYIDNSEGDRARWRTLCSSLKNNVCYKKIYFRTGSHNLIIRVADEAGNSHEKVVMINI